MEEQYQVEKSRREWLSEEREKINLSLDEARVTLEKEAMQKEMTLQKNHMLEVEIEDQRQYLSKELTYKTDENQVLCRKIDQ